MTSITTVAAAAVGATTPTGNRELDEEDRAVTMFRIKKLLKGLEAARGNGTSMISLLIPPGDQIAKVGKLLADEAGTASNIKSRVNRLSVLSAITSTQQRLKLYNKVPPNGLAIYCGTVITEKGEKQVTIDFEPHKPINTSLYYCDSRFHVEPLLSLLEDDEKFGFIIIDGNGALFAVLSGNTREILHRFNVDLPKKHGRGGQSALRFARLRMEKRHNYLRRVGEDAVRLFIPDGDKVNVSGIVLAGSADFKNELARSDLFDPRLQAKVIAVVDISYGGEVGLNQAIELAGDSLSNVKYVREKRLLKEFYDQIALDTGKYCYGVDDTIKALEMGAVEKLIIWENLDHERVVLMNAQSGEEVIRIVAKEKMDDLASFTNEDGGPELEVKESESLVDWLAQNYKKFGAHLDLVTDRTAEGSQFVKGFGGIGGILRYQIDLASLDQDEHDESDFDEEDWVL